MTGLVGTIRLFNHHINVGYYWLAFIDMVLFALASWAGAAIYFMNIPGGYEANAASLPLQSGIFAVVTSMAMYSMGLYEPKLREGVNGVLLRTAGAFGLMTVAMTLIFYVLPNLHIWRGNFAFSAAIAFTGALINRVLWTRFIDLEQFKRRVLILGTGETALSINRKMRRKADRRGFRIVGYVRNGDEETLIEREPVLSLGNGLADYVRAHNIDEVVVALEERRENLPQDELLACRAMGVRVLDVVDFFEEEAGKVLIKHVHPSWFTFTNGFKRGDANSIAKRLFDVTMSFLLLMVA